MAQALGGGGPPGAVLRGCHLARGDLFLCLVCDLFTLTESDQTAFP